MAAPSASTSNLTTTRDSVTVILEGKKLPGMGVPVVVWKLPRNTCLQSKMEFLYQSFVIRI